MRLWHRFKLMRRRSLRRSPRRGRAVAKLFARGGTVLCDGAMGSMFVRPRHLHQPLLRRAESRRNPNWCVRGSHEEYLQAGAEIIESNTFGANAFRLEPLWHAGQGRVSRSEHRLGAQLARQCGERSCADKQAGEAWVAGSIGPLGVLLGAARRRSSLGEALCGLYANRSKALVAGGVEACWCLRPCSALETRTE